MILTAIATPSRGSQSHAVPKKANTSRTGCQKHCENSCRYHAGCPSEILSPQTSRAEKIDEQLG
eukprot:1524948-Amphidinium_carterae.1